ncbi:hypothetical protein E0L36_22125 [Streptomyces sp. AJS327]|uniref:hypothetical protein n=1 Tax=Streptomyces sp. AJS327 TaxID=2545265 RepID=UPI0015DD7CE0|nr:hypothetical protein [Streptomyces sp. AJS327]MBA0053475.1 hypothetical protein [Streptomyces sp. AJS327]
MTAHPNTPDKPDASGEWEPPQRMLDAEKAMNDAAKEAERLRHEYRKVLAEELEASGLSMYRFQEHTPYTEQTINGIAKEYGVKPKRKPTVRSIKS